MTVFNTRVTQRINKELKIIRLRATTRSRFVRACEPSSFWRENVIAVVILLLGFYRECRGGGNKLSNVTNLSFIAIGKWL